MMDSKPLIQLTHVEKEYVIGEVIVPVLHGISLEICESEFTAIMGASGSGKSTLMNIVGCLDHPTRGSYFLDNQDVSSLNKTQLARVRNKTVGFVFQNFNLLNALTALENVGLPLLYQGINQKKRDEIAKELLEKLGLADRMHHFPTQLSGGQQQRVATARALANNPKILLADEPTGNLDSHSSAEVMNIFENLHQQAGLTIILVTHDADVASHAKRIFHIRDGRIVDEENS